MAKSKTLPAMSILSTEKRQELADFDLVRFVETRHSIMMFVVTAIVLAVIAVVLFAVGFLMGAGHLPNPDDTPYIIMALWFIGGAAAIGALGAIPSGMKRRRAFRRDMARIDSLGERRDIVLTQIQEQFAQEESPVYIVAKNQYITKDWLLDLSRKNARIIRLTDIAGLIAMLIEIEVHTNLWAYAVVADGSRVEFGYLEVDDGQFVGENIKETLRNLKNVDESTLAMQQESWDKLFEVIAAANPHVIHTNADIKQRNGRTITAGRAYMKKRYQAIVDAFEEKKASA